jgi:hypothetical protein
MPGIRSVSAAQVVDPIQFCTGLMKMAQGQYSKPAGECNPVAFQGWSYVPQLSVAELWLRGRCLDFPLNGLTCGNGLESTLR